MRRTALIVVTLSAALLLPACRGTQNRTNFSPVAVRFATPPDAWNAAGYPGAPGAARTSYEGFVHQPGGPAEAFHVALWGGPFDGQDVTYGVTSLSPGTYTFAFVDRKHEDMIQGWMSIHPEGHDILSYLQRWKNMIPDLKQQLAYDYEITGKMQTGDPEIFEAFTNQLDAIEEFEERLNSTIKAEMSADAHRQQKVRDLFRSAEIRLLPGREEVFQPATRAAFNEEEVQAIHSGGALTKIILVADYDTAQWKLDRVNALFADLQRVKAVAEQEADRLERRKGLFLLTDHLHDHDQRFVQNEIRLQNALALVDRVNGQLSDLRERRMALAFMSELIAPDGTFAAMDHEEQQCIRERTVLETELNRLNILFEQAATDSPRKVSLERSRQRILTSINNLESQLSDLFEARDALVAMVGTSDIIHRAGDDRLLAATYVAQDMPFNVRRAVENEAVMTVRLESRDDVFVPFKATVTADRFPGAYSYPQDMGDAESTYEQTTTQTTTMTAPKSQSSGKPAPQSEPSWQTDPGTQPTGHTPPKSEPSWQTDPGTQPTGQTPPKSEPMWQEPSRPSHALSPSPPGKPSAGDPTSGGPGSMPPSSSTTKQTTMTEPSSSKTQAETSTTPPSSKSPAAPSSSPGSGSPASKKSWENSQSSNQGSGATSAHAQPKARRAAAQSEPGPKGQGGCELPFVVKLFVPPCWFLDKDFQGGGSTKSVSQPPGHSRTTAMNAEPPQPGMKSGNERPSTQNDGWTASPSQPASAKEQTAAAVEPSQPAKKSGYVPTDSKKNGGTTSVATKPSPQASTTAMQSSPSTPAPKKGGCELPFLVKLLVPPCWFLDGDFQDGPSGQQTKKSGSKARLTALQEAGENKQTGEKKQDNECDCPLIMRLLGPCWSACCHK